MKKALSVFLSLLMVITTISVVFTLPASAVTSTAFSQDFEGYNVGDAPATGYAPAWKVYDEGESGYFKGPMPTESGWIATSSTVATGSVVKTDDETLTTGNTTHYITLADWAGIGMVANVLPNTTYTLTFRQYAVEAASSNDAREVHVYDITNVTEGFSWKSGIANYDNTALTRLAYNRSTSSAASAWASYTYTFTTESSASKVLIYFKTDAPAGFYLDDIVLTYDAKPTVKATTYGADTSNGGEAWIVTDTTSVEAGASITYEAKPYDNALFDGWYVNGVKQDTTELTFTKEWVIGETIEAKFEALSKNLWPEPSFEGYNSVTTGANLTTAANLLYRGGGLKYDHQANYNAETLPYTLVGDSSTVVYRSISQDNWTATSYGRVAIVDSAWINNAFSGVTAYSGKQVMTFGNKNGHGTFKVIEGLEANTTYTLSYWVYADVADSFNGTANNYMDNIIGAPTDENGEVVYSYMNDSSINTTATYGGGQTTLTTQTIISNNADDVVNEWVKYERTFNTGDFTAVLVPFYPGSTATYVMVDHVTLYEAPEAVTPTVSSESNFGSNDGIVYNVTDALYEGDTFTATAMSYDNATFVGFYVDDVKVESGVTQNANGSYTALLTYNEGKTYTAKFSALKANIWPEDPAPSSTTPLYKGTGHTTPKEIGANDWTGQSWATIYNVDNDYIATLGDGLKAYAGDTAYYFSSHNGHNAYKVVRGLKTNTDYTLTYWVYDNGISTNVNTAGQVVDVTKINPTINDGVANATVNYGITGIGTGETMIEVADMNVKIGTAAVTYPQVRPSQSTVSKNPVQNAWYRVERTFNTGANTDFLINFGNAEIQLVMYDHIALYETPVLITPTVTVEDGGMNAGIVYNVTGGYFNGGEEFNATSMPYENGTFAGFFKDGVQLADDKVVANADGSYTATFTYTEGAVYTVKYTAQKPNLLVDGSHENATAVTPNTSVNNYNVATPTATVETPISADGWVAGRYGGAFIVYGSTDYTYGSDAIPTTPAAFSGNKLLMMNTGWHHIGKVVTGLEANTDYVYTAWVYVTDSTGYNTYDANTYKVIGLSDDQYATGNVLKFSASDGSFDRTNALATTRTYTHEANQWVKYTAKFNTGNFTKVILPYFTQTTRAAFVDHESLVAQASPMTVIVDNTKGYLTVDGAYAETATFAAGQTATVTLNTYAGSVFKGWYADATLTGEPVSTDPALNIAAIEGATLYAKFATSNILADPGFENMSGDIEGLEATYGWYTEVQSGYGGDTWTTITVVSESTGITPYSGNKMFRLNHRNNDGALRRLTGLKKNTVYTISFMANMENDHAEGACFLEAVGVADLDVLAVSRNAGNHATDPYAFKPNSRKYQLAETVATHDDWSWTTPEWKRITLTFNSGNLEEANLLISFTSDAGAMLIDEFTVQETKTSTVSVETLNPFAESSLDVIGGKAEITHLLGEGEFAYLGTDGTAKANLKATAFNNSKFLGWYVGETLVSNEAITTVEFTEATNYVAKFAAFGFDEGTPVYVDGVYGAGFENATKSENFLVLSSTVAKPTTTVVGETTYYIPTYVDGLSWTSSNKDNYGQLAVTKEMAFEGDYSLVVRDGAKGESIFNKITGLTENTDYSLSFWYYIPEATLLESGNPANYIHYVAVAPVDGLTAQSGLPVDDETRLAFGWYQSTTVYGEWTKLTVNFNSGAYTEVALNIGYVCGASVDRTDNQPQDITNLYIDNLAVYTRSALNAAAQNAFENSVERGGVAIRVANAETGVSQALRFKARIAKERLTTMALGADYTVVEYGTLAMNAAYIAGDTAVEKAANLTLTLDESGNKVPYTNGGKNAVVGVTYNANSGANKVFAYKQGEHDLIFTAALTGIGKNKEGQELADAYRTQFVVRTYAILELADGSKIVVLDDVNEEETFCASVLDVANAAILAHQQGEQILDAETLDCVNIISVICENNPEVTPDSGVTSSYSVLYNPSSLANETVIENFFINEKVYITGDKGTHTNSRPTYYTSGAAIRCYAGNTLTLTTAEGYYIDSVVIGTLEDYPYGNATTSTGVATTEGTATTITGINSSEFVLTTPAATRITSILVNYKYGTAPDPVYPDTGDDEEGGETTDENTVVINPSEIGVANAEEIENVQVGSVVLNGGEGTNSNGLAPKYYSSDNTIRAYAGNTLTLSTTTSSTYALRSIAAAKNIKSIEITYGTETDASASSNVGTVAYDETSKTLTITDVNAREVVISFTVKAFITNIKIITEDITPCETHTYTNDCDEECNVCYSVRSDAPHSYASDCDTTCECGATREAIVAHTADACATACELCGEAVVPTHKFAGDCDAECDCGETREATADHSYADGACEVCGAIEPVSCTHEYDNNCDAECNLCFAVREELTHTYASDCDTTCEYCDATRESLADHDYEFVCSTVCTACGATRQADHDFTNGDCECGEPKPTTTTVTTNIGEYATANSWEDAKQYTTIINGNVTVTAVGGGNTGKYYTNGNNWRIYQGESGKVTISVPAGYIIVSIKLTYTNSNSGVLTLDGVQVPSGELLTVNNTSVTLAVGNTGTATNGQARITDIEVIYDIVAPCETHTYTNDCDADCDVCGTVRDEVPHAYASDCDTTCDCGATREALADHTNYDSDCDTTCNDCGAERVATHTDDEHLCDTVCSNCGVAVEATAEHTYDDDCDADCACGATREAPHEDAVLCDTICSNCGASVEATADHVYDDDSDAICNNCNFERVLESQCDHAADEKLCDTTCSVCGADVEATAEHTWTNACDTNCDVCDTVREQAHVDTILCDTVCSTCGAVVEATADHAYTDNCDADCNNCGATRTVTHDDAILCDTTCSNCGATVEATAEHNYVDGACDTCGAEQPTGTTVTITSSATGVENGKDLGTYTQDNVTIVGAKGTNSSGNTPKYYTSGLAVRFYVGNTLTVSVPDGYVIDSIVITSVSSYTVKTGMGSAGTETISGTTATFSDINAETWVLTNTNSGSTQVRVVSIVVTYKAKVVCAEHTYTDDCDTSCDACGFVRDDAPHAYASDCDTTCDCGATRTASVEHTVDDGCDTECNLCGAAVVPTHEDDDILCDTICGNCDAIVEATADHTYTDDCDADCDKCGAVRDEIPHVWADDYDAECDNCGETRTPPASCTHENASACDTECETCGAALVPTHEGDTFLCDTECSNCGATVEATADHDFTNGDCECGEPADKEPALVATFELGTDGSATHKDGSSNKTSYSETDGSYTLNITGGTNMYPSSIDAKGNGAIKLGASSKAGGFSFTVADDVQEVVIYIGKYKANTTKVTINGTTYTISGSSNDGAYDAIKIDTSTTKTITLTTVSGGYRAMVNTIEFYA